MSEIDNFNNTIQWAAQEEILRTERGNGISAIYLIIGAVIIFVFLLMFVILLSRKESIEESVSPLDIMKDEDYIYDDDYTLEEVETGEDIDSLDGESVGSTNQVE